MNIKTILSCVIVTSMSISSLAMEIDRSALRIPGRLGDLRVFHNDERLPLEGRFSVEKDGETREISPWFISKNIRSMDKNCLKQFLKHGYIQLKEMKSENGVDYKLDAYGKVNGGGPWSGAVTFFAGCAATIAASVGIIVATVPAGPVAMACAGWSMMSGGMALTGKATVVATASPLP